MFSMNTHNTYNFNPFIPRDSRGRLLPAVNATAREVRANIKASKALVDVNLATGILDGSEGEKPWRSALYNHLDTRHMQRWIGASKAIPVPVKVEPTVRRQQVSDLLERFDGLFRYWGQRYPRGNAIGAHLWSDDIAQAARLAFYESFSPHCDKGSEACNTEEKGQILAARTPTGKLKRSMQPVVAPSGVVFGKRLKPVLKVKKTFAPSCQKSAVYALKAAKFAAMRAADEYRKHGLRETAFSSGNLLDGESIDDYIGRIGENPITYANELGISSPWMDRTLEALSETLDKRSIQDSVGHAVHIEGRLGPAMEMANRKGLVEPLLLNMAGLSWVEVAGLKGIPFKTLESRLTRFRQSVQRLQPRA